MGCFWARGHVLNVAQPLAGPLQTNQRAELQAAIEVLRCEPRPVEIRTDSQYVRDGVQLHLNVWRRRGWLEVDNGDLWGTLDALLRGRDESSVRWVKVKGHATLADVRAGVVSGFDKQGNDAADALARRGAAGHAVDAGHSARLRHCKRLAQAVQRLMCDIVEARNAAAGMTSVPNDGASVLEVDNEGEEGEVFSVSSEGEGGVDIIIDDESDEEFFGD